MDDSPFPGRLESDRLAFEPVAPDSTDLEEVWDLASTERWRTRACRHMPDYRWDDRERAAGFLEFAAETRAAGERAFYAVRAREGEPAAGDLLGFVALTLDTETDVAGSGVVLDPDCWGRGYGREQLARLVAASFRDLDVAAYATECARENDRSRRTIEAVVVERFGGRHEGLLRRYKARSTGEVTDQHRFSLLREEYEAAAG